MNRTSSLIQLWQTPPTRILFRSSKLFQGLYVIPRVKFYPPPCSCKNIQTTSYEDVNGKASYVPTIKIKKEMEEKEKLPEKLETVGAFQKLPMVMPSFDILYSAIKKAKRVSPTKGIANIAKRERNRGAKQLDALMKELAVPLRTYMESFPKRHTLHPYERSLIELTLGDGNYEEVLGNVDSLRKRVVSVAKEHASLCAKSVTKREAEDRLVEGMKKVEETFNHKGKAVDDLLNIAKTLRAMPVVDLETPTLCLVGAPNVGKSSLVRVLSTGKPEICNYPFTTRGILMGHIVSNYNHFQVTDTPGLLRRCDEDRNNLEKLTLAVLSHLPTAVLYVHDLSGECGTSPSDQFIIYKEIKERFCDHLWLDVVSKCDLLQDSPVVFVTENADEDGLELAKYRKMGPDGALHVSITDEVALSKLKDKVHEMLSLQMARIQAEKGSATDEPVQVLQLAHLKKWTS
ncbi:nucleolar GTP-binding protein 1 isoform X3 [Humulus lupulus]|uniref:nucleolar GTP-binding protein 1 isoform X3 n=1 Tax=Humulus lupulus TaxID=3486 RepID=UPI002B40CC0C|nr:nucleolar GTP-binding protein 1 isoform X3 [Humulus lupulus]